MPFDWWTAFQFDSAVSYFGRYIESKLQETETRGGKVVYVHTLKDLLGTQQQETAEQQQQRYERLFGKVRVPANGQQG